MSTSVVTKALRFIQNYRGPVAATPANASDVRAGIEDLGLRGLLAQDVRARRAHGG